MKTLSIANRLNLIYNIGWLVLITKCDCYLKSLAYEETIQSAYFV